MPTQCQFQVVLGSSNVAISHGCRFKAHPFHGALSFRSVMVRDPAAGASSGDQDGSKILRYGNFAVPGACAGASAKVKALPDRGRRRGVTVRRSRKKRLRGQAHAPVAPYTSYIQMRPACGRSESSAKRCCGGGAVGTAVGALPWRSSCFKSSTNDSMGS